MYLLIISRRSDTPQKVKNFASLAHKMYHLIDGDKNSTDEVSPIDLEFYSYAGGDPRLLSIDVISPDGYKEYMVADEL